MNLIEAEELTEARAHNAGLVEEVQEAHKKLKYVSWLCEKMSSYAEVDADTPVDSQVQELVEVREHLEHGQRMWESERKELGQKITSPRSQYVLEMQQERMEFAEKQAAWESTCTELVEEARSAQHHDELVAAGTAPAHTVATGTPTNHLELLATVIATERVLQQSARLAGRLDQLLECHTGVDAFGSCHQAEPEADVASEEGASHAHSPVDHPSGRVKAQPDAIQSEAIGDGQMAPEVPDFKKAKQEVFEVF